MQYVYLTIHEYYVDTWVRLYNNPYGKTINNV